MNIKMYADLLYSIIKYSKYSEIFLTVLSHPEIKKKLLNILIYKRITTLK